MAPADDDDSSETTIADSDDDQARALDVVADSGDDDDSNDDADDVVADADADAVDEDGVDEPWAIEEDFDWSGMPAAPTAAKAASLADRGPTLSDPGAWARRLVVIQALLVLVGSAPWWGLLYLDRDWERAELAWLCAGAFGAAVALYGYRHRLSWVAAFGFVSSSLVLILQMRGASLLFVAGLGMFTGTLVAALALSAILAAVAYREIGLVT